MQVNADGVSFFFKKKCTVGIPDAATTRKSAFLFVLLVLVVIEDSPQTTSLATHWHRVETNNPFLHALFNTSKPNIRTQTSPQISQKMKAINTDSITRNISGLLVGTLYS